MEFLKKIEDVERTVQQRFDRLIINVAIESQNVIEKIAVDTRDMKFAVTYKLSRVENGNLTGEVFVDPGKLYNRRKPYQYKRNHPDRGIKKNDYGKVQRLYPIYVHDGTHKNGKEIMKARPYFTMAWNNIRMKPEFKEFAKDIIVIHGETK